MSDGDWTPWMGVPGITDLLGAGGAGAVSRDPTIDWVEREFAAPRGHVCAGGHEWELTGAPIVLVREVPASRLRCRRCGQEGFHWIPPHLRCAEQAQ